MRGVQLDGAEVHLLHHRLVGAEQQLLAGLAPGVERAGHLRAAEGAVVEQAAVLPGEGHALGDHWSMMSTDTSARRCTLDSRLRKSPPFTVS